MTGRQYQRLKARLKAAFYKDTGERSAQELFTSYFDEGPAQKKFWSSLSDKTKRQFREWEKVIVRKETGNPLRVVKIQYGTHDGSRFQENPSKFEQCVESVAKRGGARSPAGVCAAAGRKKYGKRKFAAMARAGRKKARKTR